MACLIIFVSLYVITTVNGGNSQSRPIGFVGTRGKRSTNDVNSINDESALLKLSQMISLESTNQNEYDDRYISDYLRNLPELSVFKRSPYILQSPGIDIDSLDMRGRRIPPLTAFNRIIMNPNPKRAPYGFMGMRGKKQEMFIDNKRVPVGFLGTRGKKNLNDYEEYNDEMENSQNLYGNNMNMNYHDELETWNMNENKRVPTSGFFGMRGKKLYNSDNIDSFDDFGKRAPTGFLGMRGKKLYYFDGISNIQPSVDGTEKRKMNGFFGVRGKKDVSSHLIDEDKRSFAQFFGIRGKKQPFNSGFFGMRGKKQPFQFRGKFVGVRGKKSLEETSIVPEMKKDDDNGVLAINDESVIKRNPSGFIGMRGKKIPDSDETENKN